MRDTEVCTTISGRIYVYAKSGCPYLAAGAVLEVEHSPLPIALDAVKYLSAEQARRYHRRRIPLVVECPV